MATESANVLVNVAESMAPVYHMITGAAYVIGIAFAFKALYSLKVYGEQRTMMSSQNSMKEPLMYLLIAAIFIYLPTGFAVLMTSTFGYSNVLAYQSAGGGAASILFGPQNSDFGQSITIIIQTIGVIAFVRGWMNIARASGSGQQPGGVGKGLMYVVGGIFCMNIVGTVDVINNTLFYG